MKIRSIAFRLSAPLFVLFSSIGVTAESRLPQKEENVIDVRAELESARKQLADVRRQLGEFHPRVTEQVLQIAGWEEAVRKLDRTTKTQAEEAEKEFAVMRAQF